MRHNFSYEENSRSIRVVYLHDAVLVSPLDHVAVRLVSGRATRGEGILEGYRGLLNIKEEYY